MISMISAKGQCIILKSTAINARAILSLRNRLDFCFVINVLSFNTNIERLIKGLSVLSKSKKDVSSFVKA